MAFALVSTLLASCGGEVTPIPAPTAALTTTPLPAAVPAEPTIASTPVPTPMTTPTSVPYTQTITPSASPASTTPTITIGDVSFTVDLADTPEKRTQGLSGRPVLEDGTGMLFVFQEERQHAFWMKDMNFPLDMIWINAECVIADIIADVPHPEPGQEDGVLPTYSPSAPATYVLELNAGVAATVGLQTGDVMTLEGSLTGRFGC